MAFTHIHFNDQTTYGRSLRQMLNIAETGDTQLANIRNEMSLMIDGDGSQDVHYAELTSRYGFVSDAFSHTAFSEIDSAYSKTSGNGDVSSVRAARDQMFNKFRG